MNKRVKTIQKLGSKLYSVIDSQGFPLEKVQSKIFLFLI